LSGGGKYVFPDGHLPSPRWRGFVIFASLSLAALQVRAAVTLESKH
jgi:hypothetical protein